jgi:glyceraldehyde 3-phosphate dehydrogenase
MKTKRIGINGLGRIGRKLTHTIIKSGGVEIVAINDLMPIEMAVYFLRYDSTYGASNLKIEHNDHTIFIDELEILYSREENIQDLEWTKLGIDVAINCSGTNKTKPQLSQYLNLGIPKVVLSAPPDSEEIPIVILGYNESLLNASAILSNASCTTYCVAPILDIFHRNFGIEFANFTTVHCYTADQNLQDGYHPDYRRSRAAGVNIIPTTTSATKVIRKIFPDLRDKVMGSSFRVPVINGSVTEFILDLKNETNSQTVLDVIHEELDTNYKDIISVTSDMLVSSDVIDCPYSALIDLNSIEISGTKIKLLAFYDNEAGYSNQLKRLIKKL